MTMSVGTSTIYLIAATCSLFAVCGSVQANSPDKVPSPNSSGAPLPLSERLDDTGGVIQPKYPHDREALIKPPKKVDPEIVVPPAKLDSPAAN